MQLVTLACTEDASSQSSRYYYIKLDYHLSFNNTICCYE